MPLQKNTVLESFLRGHSEETARQQQLRAEERAAQARADDLQKHQDALKQIDVENKRQDEKAKLEQQAAELARKVGQRQRLDTANVNFLKSGVLPVGGTLDTQASIGGGYEDPVTTYSLDPAIYGSFAEIGAGQDVAANFFKAGGSSGTIAKTMSAYDMTFSDAIYGAMQVLFEKHRRAVEEGQEYAVRQEQLRSAGRLVAAVQGFQQG